MHLMLAYNCRNRDSTSCLYFTDTIILCHLVMILILYDHLKFPKNIPAIAKTVLKKV